MDTECLIEPGTETQTQTQTQTQTATEEFPEIIPPSIPAKEENDESPKSETADSITIGEKLRDAAGAVFEKAGMRFRRGRGRPKKDGTPKSNDVPLPSVVEAPPVSSPMAPAPFDPVRDGLFRRSIVQAVKGSMGVLKKIIRIRAETAGVDSGFTDLALKKAFDDSEAQDAMTDFSESLHMVMKKHNVSSENAEEWSLAINGLRVAAPIALLFSTFNAEIARRRAEGTIPGEDK